MTTIKEERYKTQEGFGFGIFTIFVDGKKVFQTKPRHKKYISQHTVLVKKVTSLKDAKKIIDSRGELRTNPRIQRLFFCLFS